jgi:4-hydroxyphenylpyruvate dioxygenase-like putative hemolysin
MSLRESLERREDADMNQVYKNPFRWNTEKSLQTKVLSAIYYLDHMSQGLN